MWSSYLAIGDSTTEGYGDDVAGVPCRSWTDWVAEGLATISPGVTYTNVGRRGATTVDILRDQVPVISRMRPDFVTITGGANDARREDWSREDLEATLVAILRSVADAGAQAAVLTYPDLRQAVEVAGRPAQESWELYFDRMHEVDEAIRSAAARFGTCLLDMECYAPAQDGRYLSRDLIHPNALGYRMTGRFALERIAECFDLPELLETLPDPD